MCGRFFRHSPRDELAQAFRALPGEGTDEPAYNIAPSQTVLVVRHDAKAGQRTLDGLHWGLIPHFAKDRKIAWKLINARAETVDTLPSYRTAFTKRRCILPMNGFFEWQTIGKRKQPYAFALPSHRPFGVAAVWENWKDPSSGSWLRSCALLTSAANAVVGAVHDRMPAILEPADYARWLGEEPEHLPALKALLRPFGGEMATWPVNPVINRPGSLNDVSLLDRFELGDGGGPLSSI